MTDLFTIVHPRMPLLYSSIMDFINASYVLGLKTEHTRSADNEQTQGTQVIVKIENEVAEKTDKDQEENFRMLIRGKLCACVRACVRVCMCERESLSSCNPNGQELLPIIGQQFIFLF